MKKIAKTFITFIVMSIMLMAFAVTAYAETPTNPYIQTDGYVTALNGANPIIFKDAVTGLPAYCLDYNRGIPAADSLSGEFNADTVFTPEVYKGMQSLLLAGYPYEDGGLTGNEAQGCTQLALWCWTYETMGYGIDPASISALPDKAEAYTFFLKLLETARNQTQPDISISCTAVDMKIAGDNLTGKTTVSLHNLQNGYTLDEGILPDGMSISGFTGSDGDVLTITAPLSFAGDTLEIANALNGQDIRSALNLFWYDNSNPTQQRMVITAMDETVTAVSANLALTFEAMPVGNVNINKTGENGEVLTGAVFGIFDQQDTKIAEITTDIAGIATYSNLPLGKYYLKESTAPAGYALLADAIPFEVKTNGETVKLAIENTKIPTPTGKIRIIKMDELSGINLKGAVFGIYNAVGDEKVAELTTDADGIAKSRDLPIGDYYIKEITAPTGYILAADKINVAVVADKIAEMTITNKAEPVVIPTGKLLVIKKADGTGALLKDTVFGVYRTSDDVKITEITTDSYGEAKSELPAGEYYLRELKAPVGYKIIADRIKVSVKAGEVKEVSVTNKPESVATPTPTPTPTPAPDKPAPAPAKPAPKPTDKGELLLLKKAEQTGNLLSGAVFGVYSKVDDKKITELTTNVDGTAKLTLEVGEYYLKELKAPYGYVLENVKIYFTVVKSATVKVEVTNFRDESIKDVEVPQGGIQIPKTGEEFPTGNYVLAILCFVLSAVLSGLLYKSAKQTGKSSLRI